MQTEAYLYLWMLVDWAQRENQSAQAGNMNSETWAEDWEEQTDSG